jgi:hypothetical protein
VFAKTATGWQQTAELVSSRTVAEDAFGYSVAVSGTTMVVGAPGFALQKIGPWPGTTYVFVV